MAVYFVNENDSKPKGAFLLHSYAQVEYSNEKVKGRVFNFDVDTPERTYYLSAETQEEAYEWGKAFECASGESHRNLWAADKNGATESEKKAESEAEEKLSRMQQELSRVLIETEETVEKRVAEETAKVIQNSVSVEVASLKEDFSNARDQLFQWQHLSENLLSTIQSQDMFLGEEQKEKLERMAENFENLSKLLQGFSN